MMLTVTSSTFDILRAMKEEERAQYWLRKKLGGDKKYDKVRDELMKKAIRTHETQCSESVEWISQGGNRWLICECATYYPESRDAFSAPVGFCYYETLGSIGAFLPAHGQYDDKMVVIHFTNHFFLRFCERLGIEMRSRSMVKRFFTTINGITLKFYGERTDAGLQKVDARFPGSLGRGVVRKDGFVVEMRTFLKDVQLSPKQRRETKDIREAGDLEAYEPLPVIRSRISKSADFVGDMMREMRKVVAMGADKQSVEMAVSVGIMVVRAFVDLGYAKAEDVAFWERHGKYAIAPIVRFARECIRRGHGEPLLLAEMLSEVARIDGIKNYDVNACTRKVCEYWDASVKERIA